jgi:AraC-like DNA-binding protein
MLPEAIAHIALYVFTGLYLIQLIRYIRLFIANYRQFEQRMDNYFADREAGRLRWVAFSFYAALAIGLLAMLSALFMSHTGALLFSGVIACFYAFFAVRFLRYGFWFQSIEPAMEEDEPYTGDDAGLIHTAAFAALEKKITQWVAAKNFTQQGITRDKLAATLYTNRSYLSIYMNRYKKQTFGEWINDLRIEEAKRLLIQYPGMSVQEIAQRAGFSERSHFTRHFTKQTGLSPKCWRQNHGSLD